MTHLHWAYLSRRELRQDQVTTRCGTIVGLNDIANDWGECRCKECLKVWSVARLRMMDRQDR